MPKISRRVDSASELREELERESENQRYYCLCYTGQGNRRFVIMEITEDDPAYCDIVADYRDLDHAGRALRILAAAFPKYGISVM